MNDISNLANKYNSVTNPKDKTTEKKKPYFYIEKETFAKDLANLTFNPNLHKKYKLNDRYKNLQLGTRVTLAAVIAALGIGSGIAYFNNNSENSKTTSQTEYATELLQKDEILEDAEYRLMQYVFGDSLNYIEDPQVNYKYERSDGSYNLEVTSKNDSNVHYFYSNTLSFDKYSNSKEISNLIEDMMKLHFSSTPSQKQLQKLALQLEALENKDFKLQGKNIVAVDEKEANFERD